MVGEQWRLPSLWRLHELRGFPVFIFAVVGVKLECRTITVGKLLRTEALHRGYLTAIGLIAKRGWHFLLPLSIIPTCLQRTAPRVLHCVIRCTFSSFSLPRQLGCWFVSNNIWLHLSNDSAMCNEATVILNHNQPASVQEQVPFNGDLNNSLAVSEVAEQLAQIGDKVELSYQQRRRQENEVGLAMRAVYITLFIAFRFLI